MAKLCMPLAGCIVLIVIGETLLTGGLASESCSSGLVFCFFFSSFGLATLFVEPFVVVSSAG